MSNFSRSFPVGEELLEFRFSLIHRAGGARYWVAVSREEQYLASFYFEPNDRGEWTLADRYHVVPDWVHPLEPLLSEAIASHRGTRYKNEV